MSEKTVALGQRRGRQPRHARRGLLRLGCPKRVGLSGSGSLTFACWRRLSDVRPRDLKT